MRSLLFALFAGSCNGILELLDGTCAAGASGDFFYLMVKLGELFISQVLEPHVVLAGTLGSAQEFVELELDCLAIAVLGVLNEKYHQEGDDSRPGVDDKLPGIAEVKDRPSARPYHHDEDGPEEDSCRPSPS